MSTPANRLEREEYYTYEDWLNLDDSVRAELVDGQIVMLAVTSRRHQYASGAVYRQLGNFLEGKPCEVYYSPFGVRLFESRDTVFEPDIVVVCDQSKLDDRGCNGAPDMIIEVLSPSTRGYDKVKKFNQYLQAGVKEYWLIDPEYGTVTVHTLSNDKYVTDEYFYPETATVSVSILPGCEIDLKRVFQFLINENPTPEGTD